MCRWVVWRDYISVGFTCLRLMPTVMRKEGAGSLLSFSDLLWIGGRTKVYRSREDFSAARCTMNGGCPIWVVVAADNGMLVVMLVFVPMVVVVLRHEAPRRFL